MRVSPYLAKENKQEEFTMINKFKNWLGIESVKADILCPEQIPSDQNTVEGKIQFSSLREQQILEARLSLKERYSRGKKQEQKIDTYTLGEQTFPLNLTIGPDQTETLDFQLSFERMESQMDKRQKANFINRKIVGFLKKMEGVESTFYLELEIRVKGVGLQPYLKKEIILK